MSLQVKSKTGEEVLCEVVDGGELKSRRHLNVRGKSATLPSITGRVLGLMIFQHFFLEHPHHCRKSEGVLLCCILPHSPTKVAYFVRTVGSNIMVTIDDLIQTRTGRTSSLVLRTKWTTTLSRS